MTPNEDSPLNPDSPSSQDSLSDQGATSQEVGQLIRLVRTGEETNIELAFLLAEGLGNPTTFQSYLQSLLPLYELAFGHAPNPLDVEALSNLFQLTELYISESELMVLPGFVASVETQEMKFFFQTTPLLALK